MDALLLCDKDLAFHAGSSEVLGRFRVSGETLVIELGHNEGGGVGVLPTFAVLANALAEKRNLLTIQRYVHAVSCARPNPKLLQALKRRGFKVEDVPGVGEVSTHSEPIAESEPS